MEHILCCCNTIYAAVLENDRGKRRKIDGKYILMPIFLSISVCFGCRKFYYPAYFSSFFFHFSFFDLFIFFCIIIGEKGIGCCFKGYPNASVTWQYLWWCCFLVFLVLFLWSLKCLFRIYEYWIFFAMIETDGKDV